MSDKLEATPVFGTPLNPDLEAPGVPIIEPVPGLPLESGLARFGSLAFRTGLLDV